MSQARSRLFQGVRTRRARVAVEDRERWVTVPTGWDDAAASGLAALAPGDGEVDLFAAAECWLARLPPELGGAARAWLVGRRALPDAATWAGGDGGFGLNLAAFEVPGLGLDAAALRETARAAVAAARALAPDRAPTLRVTDLDGMLAAAGLAYDSDGGREQAVSVCALLAEAIALEDAAAQLIAHADPADSLLGAEAPGIAPRFSWRDATGKLSRGAAAMLAARGVSAEAALADCLDGRAPMPLAGGAAHAAMRRALTGLVRAAAPAQPAVASARREPPARAGGQARKVSVGGHKLFLRTAEYADGGLAEFSLSLPKESASVRAMADALGQVASLALQHGVKLPEILDIMAGTRFGPAGAVEGDPDVRRASSPLDYLARGLAAAYAPDTAWPEPEDDLPEPALPLDLPQQDRRPRLRVVG